jgi:hypothetical protein
MQKPFYFLLAVAIGAFLMGIIIVTGDLFFTNNTPTVIRTKISATETIPFSEEDFTVLYESIHTVHQYLGQQLDSTTISKEAVMFSKAQLKECTMILDRIMFEEIN